MSGSAAFDPERIVATLARHAVDYVLIGALAARLSGFPRLTADADITPARDVENLGRLAAALRDLDARVHVAGIPGGLPFDVSAATLGRAEAWTLVTDAGRVDVRFTPAGTDGYADLARTAVPFDVHGAQVRAASLADVLRMKRAADRPQDRADVVVLRRMLGER